jgi:FSR family fosmidomycin resistance protein-like MFS transporter
MFSSFLAPLLPLLIAQLGLSLSMAAWLDIARKVPALFNPFFGLLAERTNARWFVILTPALTAVVMTLLGVSGSYIVALFLLVIAGVSATLFHIPSPGMIKIASGEEVGKGMSYYMVGGEIARTFGPLLAMAGVSLWGFDGIWRLMPLGFIASGVLYWRLRHFPMPKTFAKTREKGDTGRVLKRVAPFFTVIGGYLLFQSAMKSVMTLYLPVYLVQQGYGLWYAGISLAFLQFFGVIGTFISGTLSDRIGRRRTLLLSGAGAAIAMSLFLQVHSTWLVFLLLAVIGLFLFATGPVVLALVHDIPTEMPTFLNSLYMMISFGISSFVVLLMGVIGDHYSLQISYEVAAGLAYGTIPFALMLSRVRGG